MLAGSPGYVPAVRLIFRAAVEQDGLDMLRRQLERETEGGPLEPALTFLIEIAQWENDVPASLKYLQRLVKLRPDDPEA